MQDVPTFFPCRLIGMVHLLPLPGAPGYGGSRRAVRERAVRDALTLEHCGFSAVLIENYGDAPFFKDRVPPHVVADMTEICCAVRDAISLPFGVQILRNDAIAALSVAHASGAAFIRVNVHTGAMLTDQGVIEGGAARTLRLRRTLGSGVLLFADVLVKHAVPLAPVRLADAARDAATRGRADALIVTGSGTGVPVVPDDVADVAAASAPPVYVGSGATAATLRQYAAHAHGVIVGSSIKRGGVATNPVDARRAAAFVRAAEQLEWSVISR